MTKPTPLLILRRATWEDVDLLFAWANDPETRANSFNSRPITRDEHVTWFSKRVDSHDCLILIGSQDTIPVGVVRLEREGKSVVVSITVNPEMRGKGLAGRLLEKALESDSCRGFAETIVAYVKRDNLKSLRVFEKAGFRKIDELYEKYPNSQRLIFTAEKS